jgi:4-hydroxy-tetrahydrodipicolinate synthase
VVQTVIAANDGRLPLVLGIGGNNTAAVVSEFKSTNLDQFTAVLSVSPMYNKPTQEGIYQHFSAIAKVSSKPILLYNVPGRTASNMLPETVARLAADFDAIVGVKEAAGDIVQAMKLIDLTPDNFLVISGDDMITLPMVLAGGAGVISVIGEGFPAQFSKMVRYGLDKEVSKAYQIHYAIAPAIDFIFEEGNPAGIKKVFEILEICGSTVRLPLVGVSQQLSEKLKRFIDNFKE